MLPVEDTVRIELCPVRLAPASTWCVAGGLVGVAPLPNAKLAAFQLALPVQPSVIVKWFLTGQRAELVVEMDLK